MFRIIIIAWVLLLTSACFDEESKQSEPIVEQPDPGIEQPQPSVTSYLAAVATVSPDFQSGAHALVGTRDGELVSYNDIAGTHSDVTVAGHDGKAYRIERFTGANIARFATSDPVNAPDWQYSVVDTGDSAPQTNPTNIVFASATKAYVMRYGKTTVLIVNPATTSEVDFRVSTLDLSAYDDGDGAPEMHNAVIAGDKLFITLQRLVNFAPSATAFVAVFNITTDTEIDTGSGGSLDCAACLGIPLEIRNPGNDIVYNSAENAIYVQGIGDFFGANTGGVERIDVNTYATQLIVDDDGAGASHGRTAGIAVKSATEGYLIGYAAFDDNTLYAFNPTTGVVSAAGIPAFTNIQIADIIIGPQGLLWVSDTSNATLHMVDTTTSTIVDAVVTNLNPAQVAFF